MAEQTCMRGGTHAVSARAERGPSTDRLGMARMHAGTYGPHAKAEARRALQPDGTRQTGDM